MAELQDIKDEASVEEQMIAYGRTCEMMADYLQDLKKRVAHLSKENDGQLSQELDNLNDGQKALYEAAKYLMAGGFDPDEHLIKI